VRFASVNQEIEPEHSLQPYDTAESSERINTQVLSQATQAELERLSTTLQNVHLQQRRLSNFAFEPVSLPVSRVSGHLPYRAAHIYGIMCRCHSFFPTQVLSTSPRKKVKLQFGFNVFCHESLRHRLKLYQLLFDAFSSKAHVVDAANAQHYVLPYRSQDPQFLPCLCTSVGARQLCIFVIQDG